MALLLSPENSWEKKWETFNTGRRIIMEETKTTALGLTDWGEGCRGQSLPPDCGSSEPAETTPGPGEGTFQTRMCVWKLTHNRVINPKNWSEKINRVGSKNSEAKSSLHSASRKALILASSFERKRKKKKTFFPQNCIRYRHYSFSASQQQHLENYLTFLFLSGCIQITNNVQHAVTKPLM